MQPESGGPQSNGFLGAIIVWGLLIGGVAVTWWWAKHTDRMFIAPTLAPVVAPVRPRSASPH
jgi:hypothetical protein